MEFDADEQIRVQRYEEKLPKDKDNRDLAKLLVEQKEANPSIEFDAEEKILVQMYEEKLRKANEREEDNPDYAKLLIEQKEAS